MRREAVYACGRDVGDGRQMRFDIEFQAMLCYCCLKSVDRLIVPSCWFKGSPARAGCTGGLEFDVYSAGQYLYI